MAHTPLLLRWRRPVASPAGPRVLSQRRPCSAASCAPFPTPDLLVNAYGTKGLISFQVRLLSKTVSRIFQRCNLLSTISPVTAPSQVCQVQGTKDTSSGSSMEHS